MDGETDEPDFRGLLDPAWYLSQNPDVASAALDPSWHYLRFGMSEGRSPNRYFDPQWYLSEYPDVANSGLPPLLHYARHGEAEGRRPHRHFDPQWYRLAYELSPGQSPLSHFLSLRETGKFAPCPELYAVPLLLENSDATAPGDPFAGYLDAVERTGTDALPNFKILSETMLFDTNYYLVNGSDVHDAQIDPIMHYCLFGWREGRRPNIYFDPDWYVSTNPGLARLQINPLMHYALEGEPRNRRPVPYFDPHWYRTAYGLTSDQNALAHFLANRFSQRVSPNPVFDVRWYVWRHAEVAARACDPFMHYLQASTLRNCDPSPNFSAREYRERHLGSATRAFGHLASLQQNPLVHYLMTEYLAIPPAGLAP